MAGKNKTVVQKKSIEPESERGQWVIQEIVCPQCHFSKQIPGEKIPANVRWATCPRCKTRFDFRAGNGFFDFKGEASRYSPKEPAGRSRTPWEDRSKLGLWRGLSQTFKGALFTPGPFFRSAAFDSGLAEPFAFGLLFGSLGTMFGFFWQFLMVGFGFLSAGSGLVTLPGRYTLFWAAMIIAPILVTIGLFITSGITHLLLMIVNGGRHGFRATFRVTAYGQATQVLSLIPFIGGLMGGVWLLIIEIIGLKEIHETSYARVIMAFLIPLALVFLLIFTVVIVILVFI
jgi:hypothetical protein